MPVKNELPVVDLGEITVENKADQDALKRYLIERINGNESYKPAGLKQKSKRQNLKTISTGSSNLDIFSDNKNNINFINH